MINSVRGFRDVFPPESERLAGLEAVARQAFARYGYQELRLPSVEFAELFQKSTGETSDIVQKEMFTLSDASGRRLALRPEGTPGVVRAFLEAGLHAKAGAKKFFYLGSMFRGERPQKGRYREFTQIGVEYLGNPHPAADAEVIVLLFEILKAADVNELSPLEVNSIGCQNEDCRPRFRERLLKYLHQHMDSLCDDCKARIDKNPIRAMDCKKDGEKTRRDGPAFELCAECVSHKDLVQELLLRNEVKFDWTPGIVRGLDYYTRTVFEVKSPGLGAIDAVAAGGRYDGLVKQMGGPDMAAVGWALGAERVLLAAGEAAAAPAPAVFVVSLGEASHGEAFAALQALRAAGIPADGGLFAKSLKAQMHEANGRGARFAVILGEEEARNQTVSLKDMKESQQRPLQRGDLIPYLRKLLDAAP